jgi:Lanthionine synthetase C-like protein
VLYRPEAHEALTDEPWNAEHVRAAIRAIATDAEAAFADGWTCHPLDDDDAKFRTLYLGGTGVVDALRRLSERDFVDLQRDYIAYLEESLHAPPDFPEHDPQRSLLMGETGIRLVLHRLAPSAENLDQLAALISANARDERRELMWGSPGTMLVALELGLDDLWAESADWLRGQQDEDGVWEQHLYGNPRRSLGPVHGFAGCVLALGDDPRAAEVARTFAVEEAGLANWPPLAGGELVTEDGEIRTQWCHGAPGIVASLGDLLDEDLALARAASWSGTQARSSRVRISAMEPRATATRFLPSSLARATNAGWRARGRSPCTRSSRWSGRARRTAEVGTHSGPAIWERPSISRTVSKGPERSRSRSQTVITILPCTCPSPM